MNAFCNSKSHAIYAYTKGFRLSKAKCSPEKDISFVDEVYSSLFLSLVPSLFSFLASHIGSCLIKASVTRCNFPSFSCNLSRNVGKRNQLQVVRDMLHVVISCRNFQCLYKIVAKWSPDRALFYAIVASSKMVRDSCWEAMLHAATCLKQHRFDILKTRILKVLKNFLIFLKLTILEWSSGWLAKSYLCAKLSDGRFTLLLTDIHLK